MESDLEQKQALSALKKGNSSNLQNASAFPGGWNPYAESIL